MSRNSQMEAENRRLTMKVEEMKEICTHTSSLNVKFKQQLEQEASQKENLQESNHKLKLKLNVLSIKCNELNDKVKVLEANLKRRPATRLSQPVRIISSVSDIIIGNPINDQALTSLQKRFDELEIEHQEALNVIDELEFELGDVIVSYFPSRLFSSVFCLLFHVCLKT